MNKLIEKLKIIKAISQRYNLKVSDICINDSFNPNKDVLNYLGKIDDVKDLNFYDEPICWFKMNNKKYMMKEQLKISFDMYTATFESGIDDNIDFNHNAYEDRLKQFWKTEMNLMSVFPNFLEETEDFYIFEYIEGNPIELESTFDENRLAEYNKIVSDVIKQTKNFRPINTILFNWFIDNNNNLRYVNMRQWVLADNPTITYRFDATTRKINDTNS